jgi:hypothetical protein
MAKKAGFTPQAVPPKILFPLLEGASFEEDEDIHTMWAALLANAASEKVSDTVRPGFIAILRDMAPDEAALLRAVSEQDKEIKLLLQDAKSRRASAKSRRTSDASMNSAARVARKRSLAGQFREGFRPLANETRDQTLARYTTCLQVLRNNGLIHGGRLPHLDGLGSTFLSACRPPQPGK